MTKTNVHTLDLYFRGKPELIASYLIPHQNGAVLIESGPGSTAKSLQAAVEAHGLRLENITDLLLTHIHLDHAGAAGWLARHGARVHVHPVGAPHLRNPERLLASAGRIYGDQMDALWGEFLPVPAEQLVTHSDGEVFQIEELRFTALDTPGHATHHFAYLLEDICFTGDIGGVRLPGIGHVRLPMPPPEFHLERWRQSLARLRQLDLSAIAPTHFGIFSDPQQHLDMLEDALNEIEAWIDAEMPADPPMEALQTRLTQWAKTFALSHGLSESQWQAYEIVNPIGMSAAGIYRYWHKIRRNTTGRTQTSRRLA